MIFFFKRAILDVHPNVNCGPETKIIPLLLEFITKTKRKLMGQMKQANLDEHKLDTSVSLFIKNILQSHNSSIRECTKDPNVVYYIGKLRAIHDEYNFLAGINLIDCFILLLRISTFIVSKR